MDGENHGTPYEQMDDFFWGPTPYFWVDTQMLLNKTFSLSKTSSNSRISCLDFEIMHPPFLVVCWPSWSVEKNLPFWGVKHFPPIFQN